MPMKDVVCVGQPKVRQQGAWAGTVSWLAGALRHGEHDVTRLADVITAVQGLPSNTIVDGLFLLDHGNEDYVFVGDENIGGGTLTGPGYAAQIRQLRPYMSGEGSSS